MTITYTIHYPFSRSETFSLPAGVSIARLGQEWVAGTNIPVHMSPIEVAWRICNDDGEQLDRGWLYVELEE